MIVSLENILDFLDIGVGYFTVDASHDVLVLIYKVGAGDAVTKSVEVADGTYNGDDLATELQSEINTAFGVGTITVKYSSDTKKFTIDVGAGNTIAYTHTGSDAGLLFGFNADHVSAQTITSNLAASDPSAIISVIHNSVEDWVENHCDRKFEAALYIKERHDGKGIRQERIYFEQYPVLAVNLDELEWTADKKVTRDDGGSFVDDGFVAGDKVLVQNSNKNSGLLTIAAGGVEALTLTFTDTDTIIADTDDNNVILSHFRELWINNTKIDEDSYEVNKDHIYYSGGFSEGHKNIRMTYYAGYSSNKMPDSLKLAIKIIVKDIYQKRQEEIFGVKSYKVGDISITCADGDIPKEAISILEKYRKVFIV